MNNDYVLEYKTICLMLMSNLCVSACDENGFVLLTNSWLVQATCMALP